MFSFALMQRLRKQINRAAVLSVLALLGVLSGVIQPILLTAQAAEPAAIASPMYDGAVVASAPAGLDAFVDGLWQTVWNRDAALDLGMALEATGSSDQFDVELYDLSETLVANGSYQEFERFQIHTETLPGMGPNGTNATLELIVSFGTLEGTTGVPTPVQSIVYETTDNVAGEARGFHPVAVYADVATAMAEAALIGQSISGGSSAYAGGASLASDSVFGSCEGCWESYKADLIDCAGSAASTIILCVGASFAIPVVNLVVLKLCLLAAVVKDLSCTWSQYNNYKACLHNNGCI